MKLNEKVNNMMKEEVVAAWSKYNDLLHAYKDKAEEIKTLEKEILDLGAFIEDACKVCTYDVQRKMLYRDNHNNCIIVDRLRRDGYFEEYDIIENEEVPD